MSKYISPFELDKSLRASNLNVSLGNLNRESRFATKDSREEKENILAYGTKDLLLVKCKQAIEELHVELEEEKKFRTQNEETIAKLEKENLEKDSKIRELQYKEEKFGDEIRTLNMRVSSQTETIHHLEHQLKLAMSNESGYNELQENFQNICMSNNEMKIRIEELKEEVRKKDKVVRDWNVTLENIEGKITDLESENSELKAEREKIISDNRELKRLLDESENMNRILQEKCDYIENLTRQLEQESRVMETLKFENEQLKNEVSRQDRQIEIINENHKLDLVAQEQRLTKEKEQGEKIYKEKFDQKLKEIQNEAHNEINKIRAHNQKITEELSSVKIEREHYKDEVKSMKEKMQQFEQEHRKWSNNLSEKYENVIKTKNDEIERLKSIVDEQGAVIKQYEKMMEKEKSGASEKVSILMDENKKLNDSIFDLQSKNNYLNAKLQECQDELLNIQREIKNTFQTEEEKQRVLQKRMAELEKLLNEKNILIENLNADIQKLKESNKKKKGDIENLSKNKKDVNDELSKAQAQIIELINENENLKDNQKDFYTILQTKINEISIELKNEREKRLQTESQLRESEEKIFELEMQIKKNTRAQLSSKYEEEVREKQRSQKKLYPYPTEYRETGSLYSGYQSLDTTQKSPIRVDNAHITSFKSNNSREKNYSFSKQDKRVSEFAPPSIDEKSSIRYHPGEKEREVRHSSLQESQGPDQIQSQFLNRFRNVIQKLENKLEKITHDMDS